MDSEPWMLPLRGAHRFQQNAISIISSLQNAKLLWQVQPRKTNKSFLHWEPLGLEMPWWKPDEVEKILPRFLQQFSFTFIAEM